MKPIISSQTHILTKKTISSSLLKTQYAVRGQITLKSAKIKEELRSDTSSNFKFDSLTELHIGNPQSYGQPPLSFPRQVMSCLFNPGLIDKMPFSQDVKNRARFYNREIETSLGAYTETAGYKFVRENVIKFIKNRDENEYDIDGLEKKIILCDGASNGINMVINALINSEKDGIMIPIPQYPLYSALITLYKGVEIPYFLNEDKNWQIDYDDLEKCVLKAKEKGVTIKGMVVINPGNPTGNVLNAENIEKIIKFCKNNNIVILADEVYQDNIYKLDKKFVSFKKVLSKLPEPYNSTDLFSFHSISKGMNGECGIRGGYLEMTNIDPEIEAEMIKLKSIYLCSNTIGQIMTDLMVNPPNEEECDSSTINRDKKEKNNIWNSLKKKAEIVTDSLNKMKNIKCNEVEGAMYAFPRIFFTNKIIEEAKKRNIEPDFMFVDQLLEKTGLVLVPGCGFKQKEGTYHFRTTILTSSDEKMYEKMKELEKFNEYFFNQFS